MKLVHRLSVGTLLLAVSLNLPAAEELPDDAALQARISTAFTGAEAYAGTLVQVHSHRGFILLTGQVTTADQKSQATNTVVFASSAIRRIINELEVVTTVDTSTADADAALALAVMTDLAMLDAMLAERVEAVVHKGVVFLMGALTQAEITQVAERASFVPGVAGIRTAFEILQP